MGFFGKLVQAAIDTTLIPLDIAKDVGAALEGDEINNTANKVDKIKDKLAGAYEDLDNE